MPQATQVPARLQLILPELLKQRLKHNAEAQSTPGNHCSVNRYLINLLWEHVPAMPGEKARNGFKTKPPGRAPRARRARAIAAGE